jgi:glutamate 5-kinase
MCYIVRGKKTMNFREQLKNKKKIVIKIGSSSLIHEETGGVDFKRLEKLVRIICDLKNQGRDVILVSSGAIGVGAQALGLKTKPKTVSLKQACASVGQGQLMMIYQKLFMEYNHMAAQVLLTFDAITDSERRKNAENTLNELLQQDVIPVVNENDTVATEEIEFGDNDTLSAIVAHLIKADLLILLTDIDGFYTDDPHKNENAVKLSVVEKITDELKNMAKGAVTSYGTGGMSTKIAAARIATDSGADMAILDSSDLELIERLMDGEDVGTLFIANNDEEFDTVDFIVSKGYLK